MISPKLNVVRLKQGNLSEFSVLQRLPTLGIIKNKALKFQINSILWFLNFAGFEERLLSVEQVNDHNYFRLQVHFIKQIYFIKRLFQRKINLIFEIFKNF